MKILHYISSTFIFLYPFVLYSQPKPSVLPTEKQILIRSAMNFDRDSGGYWDIQNNSGFFKKRQSIQVWGYNEGRNQIFSFVKSPEEGYYEICACNSISSRLSVDSMNAKEPSTVEIKNRNDQPNQRFQFQHLGNGHFRIFDRYGRVLGFAGSSNSNGCLINASTTQEGIGTEWVIIDHQTKGKYIPNEETRSVISNNTLNNELIKLITSGKEADVKQYFRNVAPDELLGTDNGSMLKAFSTLNANDKVTHTIWILEEVKNRPIEIRRYVYSELVKVDYSKPSFLLKQLINNYFTNYTESETSLLEKVSALQRRMNK